MTDNNRNQQANEAASEAATEAGAAKGVKEAASEAATGAEASKSGKKLANMKWKVLDSEYLFRRPWLTVRRDKVELPTGAIHDEYYVLEYPTWVNVIAITEDGEYVMIRQYRHGIGQTRFEIVAGCVEDGEDPLEGAKRELEEETGYSGGNWRLLATICGNSSSTNNLTYCYVAEGVKKTSGQHLDRTEDIEVHLMKREEVFELLKSGEILQAMMSAPLWKFFYETDLGRKSTK